MKFKTDNGGRESTIELRSALSLPPPLPLTCAALKCACRPVDNYKEWRSQYCLSSLLTSSKGNVVF